MDRSEGFGERLLGALLDRAQQVPPQLVAALVAEEAARLGGRDVCILLQDYGQRMLRPLPGMRLVAGELPVPVDGSAAGRAFLRMTVVEEQRDDGVRMYLPLLNGSDEAGVLALTLDAVDEGDRRLLRRFAGLVADMLVTKNAYTDQFLQARRSAPMSLSAEIQWALLPPMTMITPQVALAGILEPAYDVAGDSFDYAVNGDIVHFAVIDAMGHGLNAAMLATLAIGAYRHARRANVGLADLYGLMDAVVEKQFGPDQFVTAQMMRLDIATGHLQWVNAGHPAPLLIRDRRVVQALESPGTLPVGFGGATPVISEHELRRGDRVLFFTDGAIEEHKPGGQQFGMERLIDFVERAGQVGEGVQEMVRGLSHALARARGGVTTDDTTLLLVEWRGGSAGQLAAAHVRSVALPRTRQVGGPDPLRRGHRAAEGEIAALACVLPAYCPPRKIPGSSGLRRRGGPCRACARERAGQDSPLAPGGRMSACSPRSRVSRPAVKRWSRLPSQA